MSKPVITLDVETLNGISARLSERADTIHQFSLDDLRRDLLIAAWCAELLAKIRFRIAEIAANALTHPNWDRAAFARDLRELIDDAAEIER